jgi:hypothetical protein
MNGVVKNMKRRYWEVGNGGVWVVQYESTVRNEITTVYQYLVDGYEVGHITVHKNIDTGKVDIHQHGITDGWTPPNPDV